MLRHREGRKYSLYRTEVGSSLWLQLQVGCGGVMETEARQEGCVQVCRHAHDIKLRFYTGKDKK